jgi:hypothetical protein
MVQRLYSPKHVRREAALCHFRIHLGRHRKLHPINDCIHQHRTIVRKRCREARLNVLRMFEANAAHADSFRHRREVWVLKIRAHIEEPARLLLEFDEAKCAVIEYHDLDGKPSWFGDRKSPISTAKPPSTD